MPYGGDPSASDADALRFLIGDTDANQAEFTDAEIAYLLTEGGNPASASLIALDRLIAKYARYTDRSIGSLSVSASQRMAHYLQLKKTLQQRIALNALPFAGGISIAQKSEMETDADAVKPAFTRDLFDAPNESRPEMSAWPT